MQPQNLSLVYLSSQRLHDRRTKRVTLFDRTGIGLRRIQLSLHQLTIRFPVEARAKRFNILYRLNRLGRKNPRKFWICQSIATAERICVMHIGIIALICKSVGHLKTGNRSLRKAAFPDDTLGQHEDPGASIVSGNRSAQSTAATTDNQYIGLKNLIYMFPCCHALAILKISYSELQGKINSLMISEQLSLMIKVSKKI